MINLDGSGALNSGVPTHDISSTSGYIQSFSATVGKTVTAVGFRFRNPRRRYAAGGGDRFPARELNMSPFKK
jgi:hypothetical protein